MEGLFMAAGEATATAEHIPAVTSSIENVLSLQPDRLITLEKDDFVDDDDGEGLDRELEDGELSDADSDDYRLQADIAKLDAEVAAFKASMADSDSDDGDAEMIDPLLQKLPGRPRKRGPKKKKKAAERPTKRKRTKAGHRNIVEPSDEIKLMLIRASDHLMKREYDEALELISEIIRINAETYEAWMMMSSIYQERAQISEAIMAMCFAAHLRPRDFFGWMNCAQFALDDPNPDDRQRNVETAQLCFSAAIRAKPKSYRARVGKANCALEAGKSGVAAAEYVKVLRKRPYNMTILRNMAEAAFDTWSAKKYVEKAMGFYEVAIAQVRAGGGLLRGSFEWSDVSIYVEMCAFLNRYRDATLALRSLARLMVGRQEETFWDQYVDDDREWDMLDDRRHEVPDFVPGKYISDLYGAALPLDLRAKLAIYRLKLGQEEEAMRHLAWISPNDNAPDVHEYFEDSPYLIKDVANQLFESGKVATALEFYEFYERLSYEPDTDLFVQKGKCYLEIGDRTMAEDYFLRALEEDEENIDARVELAQMYEAHQETEQAFMMVNQAIKLTAQQQREDEEDHDDWDEDGLLGQVDDEEAEKIRRRRRIRRKVLREKAKGLKPERPKRQYVRRMANKAKRQEYEDKVTEGFRSKYQTAQELRQRMASGDLAAEEEWMAAAQTLVEDFRSFKDFYPWDKYLSFMGYGSFFQENKKKQPKDKQSKRVETVEQPETTTRSTRAGTVAAGETELTAMAERLQQNLAPNQQDNDNGSGAQQQQAPVLRRQDHRGIPFDNWLDLLLDYAVSLARRQQAHEAYVVCQSARDSIVYKSSDSTFLIHVAWAACAVIAADEETCVAIARFFMTFQYAASDSYRVFGALCRLCQSPVSWYSSGPAQKYILRQIKMMDRGLLPADLAQSTLSTWDTALPPAHGGHQALDVALLMLYGHILLTSTSYTYALNYFLRAASLDPTNPMVNLSSGIAYVHYAMKRQSDNRQFILAQGMHYLFRYYDEQMKSTVLTARLEAHYNLGRCYHLLGLFHLAAEYYGRCLGEAAKHRQWLESRDEKAPAVRAFVYESAVNLRTYSLTNGDFEGARALTETWLVL